ncbi:MAG: hypothetical protein A2041_12370 [Bacteroidetes bacterium GWA2_31_9b]|nr:MAG: hypothetical protein A2041_12370 [Bacteroidetes bacterium GWA2_31_9b]
MAKTPPKLLFNKNKTIESNYNEFEKYVKQLDKDFGNILLQNIDKSPDEIREITKDVINNFINKKMSNE